MSTTTGCNQWFSLAKPTLKWPLLIKNCSMVARTTRCGWAISQTTSDWHVNFLSLAYDSAFFVFCSHEHLLFSLPMFTQHYHWCPASSPLATWTCSTQSGSAMSDRSFVLVPLYVGPSCFIRCPCY